MTVFIDIRGYQC